MPFHSSITIVLLLVLAIIQPDDSLAFSARKSSQLRASNNHRSIFSSSTLSVGVVWMDDKNDNGYHGSISSVDGDVYLLSRAAACADGSDSCSLEEAQMYLDDILHQQMDCIGAGVLSTKAAICDNVDVTADIIANLREKIQIERQRLAPVKATVHVFNVMLGVYVISTILHGVAAVPNVPVDSPLYTDFLSSSSMSMNTRGVTPILPQEIVWSIRDGYFRSFLTEFIHNGGLVVDTSAFDEKVVAFTPQEWIWSIRNGSLGHLLQENMNYGGLVVDSDFNSATTPMTVQDVVSSIQGGYVGTAAKHFFRNGGV